jgi:hyperosmotically inducible protein
MRTRSTIRCNMFSIGLAMAFAAAPIAQAVAQDAGSMQKPADNQTVPDKAADAWITTKVKSELATAKGLKATNISVSTNDGVVMLTGTVATDNEKTRAMRVAELVKGVKSVQATGLSAGATPPGG